MFTNSASLALLANGFVQGCIGLTLMAEMPAFMNQQLGINIKNSGLLSAMPYVCNYLSVEGFSFFFDYCMVSLRREPSCTYSSYKHSWSADRGVGAGPGETCGSGRIA